MMERVEIGPATLYHGDALEIVPTLAGYHAAVFDAPYGQALRHHGGTGDRRRRKPRAYDIAGDGDQTVGIAVIDALRSSGVTICAFADLDRPWPGKWNSRLIWDKGEAVGGGGDTATTWKQTAEMIQVHATAPLQGRREGAVIRVPWNVQFAVTDHPAEKPVEIYAYLIRKVSRPGQTILDPFMGSGTGGVAAIREGRRYVGVEIGRKHFDTARRRIEDACRRPSLFLGSAAE